MARDTLQTVLADFFRDEAGVRRHQAERFPEDVRITVSAKWLSALASFVAELADDDPGIVTLASFGWPVDCFRHGTGPDSVSKTWAMGFRGSQVRPETRPPASRDLERLWTGFVLAAQRDAIGVERILAILDARGDSRAKSRWRKP